MCNEQDLQNIVMSWTKKCMQMENETHISITYVSLVS
jgi:hypothetical protein